jgi:hypothetical protein
LELISDLVPEEHRRLMTSLRKEADRAAKAKVRIPSPPPPPSS